MRIFCWEKWDEDLLLYFILFCFGASLILCRRLPSLLSGRRVFYFVWRRECQPTGNVRQCQAMSGNVTAWRCVRNKQPKYIKLIEWVNAHLASTSLYRVLQLLKALLLNRKTKMNFLYWELFVRLSYRPRIDCTRLPAPTALDIFSALH